MRVEVSTLKKVTHTYGEEKEEGRKEKAPLVLLSSTREYSRCQKPLLERFLVFTTMEARDVYPHTFSVIADFQKSSASVVLRPSRLF